MTVDSHSPVWPWLMSLLKAACIREDAEYRMGRQPMQVAWLAQRELKAWGELAARARGTN